MEIVAMAKLPSPPPPAISTTTEKTAKAPPPLGNNDTIPAASTATAMELISPPLQTTIIAIPPRPQPL
jgi:hypothetical protein